MRWVAVESRRARRGIDFGRRLGRGGRKRRRDARRENVRAVFPASEGERMTVEAKPRATTVADGGAGEGEHGERGTCGIGCVSHAADRVGHCGARRSAQDHNEVADD